MLHTIERLGAVDFGPWEHVDGRESADVAAAIIATMPAEPTPAVTNALLQMAVAVRENDPNTSTADSFCFAFIDDDEALQEMLWGWSPAKVIEELWFNACTITGTWLDEFKDACCVELDDAGRLSATSLGCLRELAWGLRHDIVTDWADMEDGTEYNTYRDLDTPRCVDFRRLTRHADVDNINKGVE